MGVVGRDEATEQTLLSGRCAFDGQLNHTNFVQGLDIQEVQKMRGTYNGCWTVYWIAAHFLNAAAQFAEMGVEP